jgi:predicted carbohydrate-binding protein with CBM5 and CBM33 domain
VNFGGLRGHQEVLAVWNIAGSANSFYNCIAANTG